ncbi:hypothetical protein KUTeg_003194 [Tegillarca granosa]|uniref:SGNH hydrolase-type esterase domain-containing protein n=1 Tax=Tegillarca granosa TaxID=220873 RepID=A0ABQ9FQX1_TEGGR|nr:hypothetical protein KUTeg_003194 [Tegillarca granosa]
MPITVDILQKILHSLPFICFSNYEIGLFSALFSLTFFGFFRVGELVVESPLKQGHALQSHNIRFILRTNSLEIVIPHSKTDKNGKGSVLLIPPTYMPMCAVKTVKQYMNLRPPHLGPFFCHLSGLPVTKYQFVSVLRKCLNFANIDTKIGAASTCAMLGMENMKIAELGRWNSSVYKNYIHCPRVVWIVGSSMICHAMIRAINSTFKKNLQLETNNLSVLWQGKPGMRWEQVFNKIKHLITFIDPPEFLLLHCSGNDIGSSLKSVELIHLILNTIVKIFKLLPKTRLIWSQILPRLEWRNEVNHRALKKVRVRVNRKIANFVLKNNGFYIKYPELIESNTGCFSKDNVHLSDLGNDLFLFRIQQALQTFLTTNHIVSPPYGESGPWLTCLIISDFEIDLFYLLFFSDFEIISGPIGSTYYHFYL